MGQYEWLVITCRACRRVIKLAPAMAGQPVICPHCRTKINVPKDAPVIQETPEQSQIPVARVSEDMTNLRGREDWQVGQRQIGGELEFKDKLHSTADPEMQRNPNRKKHRRNTREEAVPEFDDLERRRKRRRKGRAGGAEFTQTITKILVAVVLLLLGMVGWLGWEKWHRPKPEAVQKPELVQLPSTELTPGSDGEAKLETRHFAEYGPALADAARRFAAAATVEEMLPLVRDRERVEPKIRAWHTGPRAWQPMEINNKFQPEDSLVVDGEFIVLDLQFPNGDARPVTFERSGDTFLADWESFTGYGEMTWEELREKLPRQPVLMRVVVERSPRTEYWDGVFADHTSHHCYLLRDMESNHFLSGYAKKDTPPDVKLRQFLQPVPPPGTNLTRCFAVVRISYPPDSGNKQQVVINEVLENGWVFRADK